MKKYTIINHINPMIGYLVMKHEFILNPITARGAADTIKENIRAVFGANTEIKETKAAGDASVFACNSESDSVIAVGGDGTVREVAEGLLRSGKKRLFGVIPVGSGNDFSRLLYKKLKTVKQIINGFSSLNLMTVDAGTVCGKAFLNIASAGYDAEIVKNAERYKKSPLTRRFSYILSIFYTLSRFKGMNLDMEIDGNKFSGRMLLLAVANGNYYGGGIKIAPNAIIDDGLFDIIYIPMLKPLRILLLLPRLLNGSHVNIKEVTVIRGKHVKLHSLEGDILLNADGDTFEATDAEFTIIPGAMDIYCEQ